MKALKFKTTIKCSGCIAQSTPFLNAAAGSENWVVDVNNEHKILTVKAGDDLDPQLIIYAVEKAGYKAEEI